MNIDGPQIQAQATMRYLTEPEFHARVSIAVELANFSCKGATGLSLSQHGNSVAVQTAAFALMVAELDLTEGVLDQATKDMHERAEAMGFTVVQQDAPTD